MTVRQKVVQIVCALGEGRIWCGRPSPGKCRWSGLGGRIRGEGPPGIFRPSPPRGFECAFRALLHQFRDLTKTILCNNSCLILTLTHAVSWIFLPEVVILGGGPRARKAGSGGVRGRFTARGPGTFWRPRAERARSGAPARPTSGVETGSVRHALPGNVPSTVV